MIYLLLSGLSPFLYVAGFFVVLGTACAVWREYDWCGVDRICEWVTRW